MNMAQAKRIADILKTLDDAECFGAAFREPSEDSRNYILFEDVVEADNIDGDGTRGAWEGEIKLPRDIAIEMMEWLKKRVKQELSKLGVEE